MILGGERTKLRTEFLKLEKAGQVSFFLYILCTFEEDIAFQNNAKNLGGKTIDEPHTICENPAF